MNKVKCHETFCSIYTPPKLYIYTCLNTDDQASLLFNVECLLNSAWFLWRCGNVRQVAVTIMAGDRIHTFSHRSGRVDFTSATRLRLIATFFEWFGDFGNVIIRSSLKTSIKEY